ncbi:T6SS effector BTH_I2691 family protein [Herbaspirillum sp. C7C8]|uniref:T6SS effector BTH_I2691 family protein n=1 Tax=Herbaspirillum sp. C7C8 TaxID=2736665 RepID=UPI001F520112|nr:T6SS effector BTH_I2691 family protein [Herbaspirillum sp. C7C8]
MLIYPVRYAVASPYGAQAVPAISGNFRIEGAPRQIGEARYTLRALRPGYLYAYDECRARLKACVVMPTGHLWNFPLEYNPPHPGRIPFSCVDPGEIVRAYCVDIAHTPHDPATRLWIGWSNTAWTKALQKKVSETGWRRKHMQCIDVAAMLAGTAPHAGEFNACKEQVAHFAADTGEMARAFSFSNTPPAEENKRHAWAGKMADIMAAQAPHHKGYVVAINDPVGLVNDLSELCVPGLAAGCSHRAATQGQRYPVRKYPQSLQGGRSPA